VKVLFLNQYYRPDAAATGQYVADVAQALARRGHEVHVVCTRGAYGGGRTRYPREEIVRGVHVHRVGATGFGRGHILGRGLDYVSFYTLAWKRVMALGRMDVCVSLTTPPLVGLLAAALGRRRAAASVHWVMDMYPELLKAFGVLGPTSMAYRAMAWASGRIYRRAARVVSLGTAMTRRLGEAGVCEAKIVMIDNWVPAETDGAMAGERSALPASRGGGDEVTVMYSGNLGVGHDLETLLRAAGALEGTHSLRLVFVGDGRARPALEGLTRELSLERVSFNPPVALAELADSLAGGDIHVVSQREGTQGLLVPSKIYGILAAGRPVVFIGPEDTEVARMLQASGAGLVVPPGDDEATARALETLAADKAVRHEMGAKGRAWYKRHLGMERSVEKWVRVIEDAGRQSGRIVN